MSQTKFLLNSYTPTNKLGVGGRGMFSGSGLKMKRLFFLVGRGGGGCQEVLEHP